MDPAPWIINCIKKGYKLVLCSILDNFYKPNWASALEHIDFMSQVLQELEENRCIIKVPEQPDSCSPLSAVANTQGKLLLEINLHYLNQFISLSKTIYE